LREQKKKAQAELDFLLHKKGIKVKQPELPEGTDPKTVLCEFFKWNCCSKGDKCKFSHDIAIAKKVRREEEEHAAPWLCTHSPPLTEVLVLADGGQGGEGEGEHLREAGGGYGGVDAGAAGGGHQQQARYAPRSSTTHGGPCDRTLTVGWGGGWLRNGTTALGDAESSVGDAVISQARS
jgi:hypothetical protein